MKKRREANSGLQNLGRLPAIPVLFFAELRVDEIRECLHSVRLVLALGDDGELRALDESHAHEHEDALGIDLLALCLDLDLGLELGRRLDEHRCGTCVDARLVLNHNCFLRHVNLSHPNS